MAADVPPQIAAALLWKADEARAMAVDVRRFAIGLFPLIARFDRAVRGFDEDEFAEAHGRSGAAELDELVEAMIDDLKAAAGDRPDRVPAWAARLRDELGVDWPAGEAGR